MADPPQSDIIQENPIGKKLGDFRAKLNNSQVRLDHLDSDDLQDLTLELIVALLRLPTVRQLPSKASRGTVRDDLLKLNSAVSAGDFDCDRIKLLFTTVASENVDDSAIWAAVYKAIAESTPPPPPPSAVPQTPLMHTTGSFANALEHRKDVDIILKGELGHIYVGIPRFCETYFGQVSGLNLVSEAVFQKCTGGSNPLFNEGWTRWPPEAEQDPVLAWLEDITKKLAALSQGHDSTAPAHRRRLLAQPNVLLQGSTAGRKLDVGFVNDQHTENTPWTWSQILVPGELKSKSTADTASKAWLDISTYAREVLAAQDSRRFVLAFTICGSLMRLWEFDRLGAIASEQFDINKDGLQFVTTILGFLHMTEEELGFDPTIMVVEKKRFIQIRRNDSIERIRIDDLIIRTRCIAGRATTCWEAYCEEHPEVRLVIKDSWQPQDSGEEGKLLHEATDAAVINVARYYHHETVHVHGQVDDVQKAVRRSLDITEAKNYQDSQPLSSSPMITSMSSNSRRSQGNNMRGRKRSLGLARATMPATKRPRLESETKASDTLPNRFHQRVILRDYGKPIYLASSPTALLGALRGCIQGHESLYKAGILHRDISINNLMINEDDNNPSWPSFLIDLDHSIRLSRVAGSGSKRMTGTRAFMAIQVLLQERQHSFMDDLESFFWVLFWICIHYTGPDGIHRTHPRFDKWNYLDTGELIGSKYGVISGDHFENIITTYVTPYYQPLIGVLTRLREVIFPGGKSWQQEDETLYSKVMEILQNRPEGGEMESRARGSTSTQVYPSTY